MIGIAALRVARARGAERTIVVSRSSARRELASRLGADVTLDPEAVDFSERLRALSEGRGPDLVIEADGRSDSIRQATVASRKGGRTVIVGLPPEPVSCAFDELVLAERQVIGSLSHVWNEDFRVAVQMLAEDLLTAEDVASARIPLDATVSAGLASSEPGDGPPLKVLVSPIMK